MAAVALARTASPAVDLASAVRNTLGQLGGLVGADARLSQRALDAQLHRDGRIEAGPAAQQGGGHLGRQRQLGVQVGLAVEADAPGRVSGPEGVCALRGVVISIGPVGELEGAGQVAQPPIAQQGPRGRWRS